MSGCCKPPKEESTPGLKNCPSCQAKGRSVDRVTLKCLLIPEALKRLSPEGSFRFCSSQNCGTVYFSKAQSFTTEDMTVPVFQKDEGESVHVCYCFDYTRKNLRDEVRKNGSSKAVEEISALVKKGRCACEFRNPQGNCCLGNVQSVVKLFQTAGEE